MRAEAYEELGDEASAMVDLNAAITADCTNVPAVVNRAVLHFRHKHYENALRDMNDAIALDGQNPEHLINRAELHAAMNACCEQERDLRQAAALRRAAWA